ncbi:MAG TPA: hypothetical protein DDZ89_18575 [Clostridiales bacterium]|nr:hypothetical protein [Clostridiales bacterium]
MKKEGIISIVLSAFFISATLFAYSLTFPYFIEQEITSPLYELSTLIDYGRHIQRLEPIFFTLIFSSLITTTVIYYAFITIYCKMFKISDRKPIIIAGVFVLMSASLLQPDVVSTFEQVQVLRKYTYERKQ